MASESRERLEKGLAKLHLIVGAMLAFVAVFALVAVFLVRDGRIDPDPDLEIPLFGALAALAVSELVAYLVLRTAHLNQLRRKWQGLGREIDAATELLGAFTTIRLIAAVMAEATALFAIVVFLLTANYVAMTVPVIVLFLLLALRSSADDYRQFVDEVSGERRV